MVVGRNNPVTLEWKKMVLEGLLSRIVLGLQEPDDNKLALTAKSKNSYNKYSSKTRNTNSKMSHYYFLRTR